MNTRLPQDRQGGTVQDKAVERFLADGWTFYPNWDLRPWGGPVLLQKDDALVGVGPDGRHEPVNPSELPKEDARWMKRQDTKDRLLKPFRVFRMWRSAFGCGVVTEKNRYLFEDSAGVISSGRWVCLGQPEVDDARWLRAGPVWLSWPLWWIPGSLKRARRRFHGH